ncbi:MAG: helix-turn-helix transcriptional regulator [Subdoligranulum sp.]|nr:helix-turn-helix transcriptional regulator [Subdoligranulum sp.]MBD5101277.1 helix-turn-helix transcriptional regulator [Subdoligranulum sp.]
MNDNQLDAILVGQAISKERQNKGITQEVLSGLANIGRTHLSAIERGERKPTLETLWRIAAALDMRPSELVRRIEQMTDE